MSEYSIKQYHNELEKIIHFGGNKKKLPSVQPF